MKIKVTADLRRFRASLRAVAKDSRHDDAYIVNKALKDVAFRAAQHTPKSSVAKIRASLTTEVLAKLAAAHLKKTQGKFTKAELALYMQKIVNARRNRIGALRAGWIPAIQALGGTYRGAKKKQIGSAAQGLARKATIFNLRGLIRNAIVTRSHNGKHSAEDIAVAVAGLNSAILFVTRDRERFARDRKERTLRRHSDK